VTARHSIGSMNAASLRGSQSSFFVFATFITIPKTGLTARCPYHRRCGIFMEQEDAENA